MNTKVLDGEMIDMAEYGDWRYKFEKAARSYLYYLYMLEREIINAPVDYCDVMIEKFQTVNETMWQAYEDCTRNLGRFRDFLTEATDAWASVVGTCVFLPIPSRSKI